MRMWTDTDADADTDTDADTDAYTNATQGFEPTDFPCPLCIALFSHGVLCFVMLLLIQLFGDTDPDRDADGR